MINNPTKSAIYTILIVSYPCPSKILSPNIRISVIYNNCFLPYFFNQFVHYYSNSL